MELFNFIYKNQSLVNSLYAQIFSGLLSSQEDKIESSNQSEHKLETGLPAQVFSVGSQSYEHTEESSSRMTNPHDVILSDVLTALRPSMKTNVFEAKIGTLVHLKGNLQIIPSEFENLAIQTCLQLYEKKLPDNIPGMGKKQLGNFLQKALKAPQRGNHFIFNSDSGGVLKGILNNSDLMEDPDSIAFKFGSGSLRTEIVAVVESTELDHHAESSSFLDAIKQFSDITRQLYSSGLNAIPVTPITIFYRIEHHISE